MKKCVVVGLFALIGSGAMFTASVVMAAEVSLEQATKQVIDTTSGGRVLSAKTEAVEGRKVYVIKVLTRDGRIQQQIIAAESGALLDVDNN